MAATSGAVLRRNIAFNLIGQAAPVAAAVVAVPPVLAAIGGERFGILALAWAVMSLAGVFDLGVARALTKLVAERIGREKDGEVASLVSTALTMALALGIVAAGALLILAPWLVQRAFQVPPHLAGEAVEALDVLALSLPLILIGTTLRGVLEARQRFDLVNAVRVPMGVLLFVAPLLVIRFSTSLVPLVGALVAARGLALVAYLVLVGRTSDLRLGLQREEMRAILGLGGWMTVSNLVAPVLLYLDRFVVASIAGLNAVTHYATPFEVIGRLAIVPQAVMGVLFPALSRALAEEPETVRGLYHRSLGTIALLLAPPALAIAVLARPALTLWLGPEFAAASHVVATLLALGVLVHGLAQPSFHLLQAAGRPDITAGVHLVEAPLYVAYLWWLTAHFGIAGTACAWLVRVSLSCTALTALAHLCVLGRATAPTQGAEGER